MENTPNVSFCFPHVVFVGLATYVAQFFAAPSVSVKVKLTVLLLCVCVHSAWKGRPKNDLYCVGWDVKPYSLTHSRQIQLGGLGE